MKIGVISDVHANKYSLKAALEDMNVETIVCCGDIIGYGPHPLETTKMIKEKADIVVQGNHDRWITNPNNYNNPEVIKGLKHAQKQLHNHHIQWLQNLPDKIEYEDSIIFHSHPVEKEKKILPKDTKEFEKYFSNKTILYGHTHHPCNNNHKNIRVVNPGSTSQPRGEYKKPTYAVINKNEVEIRTINYDKSKTIRDIKENTHLPNKLIRRIK